MTTIAWDGKTLAADTLCTGPDDNGVFYGAKIFRTRMGLFGACGDEDPIKEVEDWLNAGANKSSRPHIHKKHSFGGLLIRPDGAIVLLSRQLAFVDYFAGQKVAIGSGGDFALALMRTGMSAPEAVQKVIDDRMDINTGGTVQTLVWGGRHRRNC